jgi:hypothetical protein
LSMAVWTRSTDDGGSEHTWRYYVISFCTGIYLCWCLVRLIIWGVDGVGPR